MWGLRHLDPSACSLDSMRFTARKKKIVAVLAVVLCIGAYFGLPWLDKVNRLVLPSGRHVLDNADDLELVALLSGNKPTQFTEIGTVSITDPAQRRQILDSLYTDIRNATDRGICFWPHHLIRARRGERQIELVICFHCQVVWVRDGDRRAWGGLKTSSERLLDRVLLDAGVLKQLPKYEEDDPTQNR